MWENMGKYVNKWEFLTIFTTLNRKNYVCRRIQL